MCVGIVLSKSAGRWVECLWPLLWHVSQLDFRRLSVFNGFWQARRANFCRTSKYSMISIHSNDSSQNWLRHLHQAIYIKASLYQNVFWSSKVHLADRTTSRSFFFSSLAAAAFSSSFTSALYAPHNCFTSITWCGCRWGWDGFFTGHARQILSI